MIAKLSTGVLLIMALLLHGPAHGQSGQQSSDQTHAASMSKTSVEMESSYRLDLPADIAAEAPLQRRWSAGGLASKLIDVLASRNAITFDEMSSGPMDAYLRPPQKDTDDSGLFGQARSIYYDATTLQSENAEVTVDPLKMRCAVRINLNRLLSN